MAMIYHPNADLSKGEPLIEFTSPPELTDEKTNETGNVRIGSLGVPPEISRSGIHQDIIFRQPDEVSA